MNWPEFSGLVLPLALVLDLIFGDPPNLFHPVAWMGRYIQGWEGKAPSTGTHCQLFFGLMLVITGAALFGLPLMGLGMIFTGQPLAKIILAAILLKPVFSIRYLLETAKSVEWALQNGDIMEAQRLTSFHLVSRPTSELDVGHLSSAVVESLAENVSDSIVAPFLAFTLGGLPVAWAYRFVNTADAMIGYHGERYEYFGKSAAIIDDVLNFIPARLSGVMICIAATLNGEDWRGAWRIMLRDHGRTASPNAGWPMSAAAGALGIGLQKPAYYTLNPGIDLPVMQDIDRARRLVLVSALLWAVVCVTILTLL